MTLTLAYEMVTRPKRSGVWRGFPQEEEAIPHLAGAIVGSLAGWYAAAEFVQRVAITDAMRIVATGGLFLMAAVVFVYTLRQVGAGRWRP